jgi:hypothetical protein
MLRKPGREIAMTVKLELQPDLEAGLLAAAQARGLSLEAYLQQAIQGHAIDYAALPLKDWEREFEAWVGSFPETPPLSDEAVSRASMYPDRW